MRNEYCWNLKTIRVDFPQNNFQMIFSIGVSVCTRGILPCPSKKSGSLWCDATMWSAPLAQCTGSWFINLVLKIYACTVVELSKSALWWNIHSKFPNDILNFGSMCLRRTYILQPPAAAAALCKGEGGGGGLRNASQS